MNIKFRKIVFAVMAVLLTVSVSAAFEKTEAYNDGMFSDVENSAWYADEVKNAFELGFMNGVGENSFSPAGEITVAEAVTMASRVNAKYFNKEIPDVTGENWYDKYVAYALENGIAKENQFDDLSRPAKRYETALLFAACLPENEFAPVNSVKDIPDVPDSRAYKNEVLKLYNAGVVMGADSYGFFYPENNVTRAEAAAIINRVALPQNRLEKKLDVLSKDDSFYLCTALGLTSEISGIGSGWLFDNRGGTPRTSLNDSYNTTNDISETAGTALIREFNKTSTGNITLYTEITVLNSEGFYIEFRNASDKSVYHAEIIDGKWCIAGENGNSAVYTISDGETLFKITASIDLDNGRSTTVINGNTCGEFPLLTDGEECNIYNFRYATTDKSMASYRPTSLSISSNYTLDEDFSRVAKGALPYGFEGTGGAAVAGDLPKEHLSVPGGASVSYGFAPVSGVPVVEFRVLQPEKEAVSFTLKSGSKKVAEFTADSNNFYVNGKAVYENYYKNLWYRVRLEADTDTNTVLVKINGRKMATVPFGEAATSVDGFTLANNSETTVSFDNLKVFRIVEHDDYVPKPVVPKGADDYYIGMNVCSLWRNGSHYGWGCITPFDDPRPVLGYYDEGVPETADWEIKYLVEHGIDFQAFCLFFYHDGPFNIDATHLYDGFMNAKYADMSDFCILLEAANGDSPSSVEDWKERWVPYIIENFIKHESYAVKNNRPIFSVFGTGDLAKRLGGSYENVKACFDYLEDEVMKLGFDGMIYLGCGSSSTALQSMGFDGCHAYNWSYTGFDPNHNINSIVTSGDKPYVYTVPTVSVGFNHVPWGGSRYPLMTMEDYKTAQEWVRDEYLPAFAEQPWQENLVWLSTWNEYGEGTYIMPSTDEKGFGYIDTVREVFTDEKADASLNTVPTEAQKYRINHLYPQYRRILRAEGYYEDKPTDGESEVLLSIDARSVPSADLWSMKNIVKDENGVTASGTNGDPIFSINKFEKEFNTDDTTHIRFTARIPKSSLFQIYYATGTKSGASESRVISGISTTDELTDYYFSVDTLDEWGGKLNYIRIDPVAVANLEFTVKSVDFIRDNGRLPKKMNVDGKEFELKYAPIKGESGDILVAFDPTSAFDYRLSIFHEWNKEDGVLELHFEDCDIIYTVGSDKYLLNGEEKSLGFNLGMLDGMPLVPIEKLCKDAGYKYSMNDNKEFVIETKLKAYYDSIAAAREPGKWEFNVAGDTEKWSSSLMTVLVNSGYMACDSRNDTWTLTDPTVVNSTFEKFTADDKVALELRVRYNFEPNNNKQVVKMYFRTDVNTALSEKNSISVPLEATDTKGEWVVIRMPLPETFKGNVTYLRFDPFDAFGHIDIDYIRFLTEEEAGQTEE